MKNAQDLSVGDRYDAGTARLQTRHPTQGELDGPKACRGRNEDILQRFARDAGLFPCCLERVCSASPPMSRLAALRCLCSGDCCHKGCAWAMWLAAPMSLVEIACQINSILQALTSAQFEGPAHLQMCCSHELCRAFCAFQSHFYRNFELECL